MFLILLAVVIVHANFTHDMYILQQAVSLFLSWFAHSYILVMFPSMSMGKKTELLEGKGVRPDVEARDLIPYTAGADPILAAGIEVLGARCEAASRKR